MTIEELVRAYVKAVREREAADGRYLWTDYPNEDEEQKLYLDWADASDKEDALFKQLAEFAEGSQ